MNKFKEQNNISRKILEINKNKLEHSLTYRWNTFIINENVFSPKIFNAWEIFTNYLLKEKFENKKMLEIWAWTWITGFSLFLNKNLKSLTLTDINNYAVENCKINKEKFKISWNIKILKSNVFENINEKFDIIYWNFPWILEDKDYQYKNELEKWLFDPWYLLLEKYISGIEKHLEENWRSFIWFWDFWDLNMLKNISKKYWYILKILIEKTWKEWWDVKFILYEFIKND